MFIGTKVYSYRSLEKVYEAHRQSYVTKFVLGGRGSMSRLPSFPIPFPSKRLLLLCTDYYHLLSYAKYCQVVMRDNEVVQVSALPWYLLTHGTTYAFLEDPTLLPLLHLFLTMGEVHL